MQIENGWKYTDAVTGIMFTAIEGKDLNRIHMEGNLGPNVNNRDLFFTKEGKFDGTGSAVDAKEEKEPLVGRRSI